MFPTCKIGENLCGSVEVRHRPRTQYVPIIPCSKHPPATDNPLLTIISDTISCQNIPLNLHAVKQLKKKCDTGHQNTIMTKTIVSVSPTLTGTTMSTAYVTMNSEETSTTFVNNQSKNLKYLNSQVNVENVLDFVSNLSKDCTKKSHHVVNPFESQVSDADIYQNIYLKCSSQENISHGKHQYSAHFQDSESMEITSDNDLSNREETFCHEVKKIPFTFRFNNSSNLSKSMFCSQTIPSKHSNSQNFETSLIKNVNISRKRKFSDFRTENTETNIPSQITHTDQKAIPAACTSSSCSDLQKSLTEANAKKSKLMCTLNLHLPLKILNFQENLEVSTQQRATEKVLSDVKNTSENFTKKYDKGLLVLEGKKLNLEVLNSSQRSISGQGGKGGLPLPSSPVPSHGDTQNTSALLHSVPTRHRKKLFPKPNFNIDCFPKHISTFRKSKKLLGSFEESILKGRLQPVNSVKGFTVDIGASGSFFPDHLTLPANVYFYEIGSPYEESAPYMAHVILENIDYYVPKKGAVQVTLFNPSETVVRIFVVNYDLTNMPPKCHTFMRQRTYYMPLDATEEDPSSKKWLRYVIHLRFASSKSGKIFLHSDFKLVIIKKSDVDAASIHSEEPRELRSFVCMPTNPTFSRL